MVELTYSELKSLYESLGGRVRVISGTYYRKIYLTDEIFFCEVEIGSSDDTDYLAHELSTVANAKIADDSGRLNFRQAATDAGWALLDNYSTLTTSVYGGGILWEDISGNTLDCTSYHYNSSNVLLTNQTDVTNNCVRTDFVFKFGEDIDLDRGAVMQKTVPANNFQLFGAFGAMNGGTIVSVAEFIRNLNLKHCPVNYPIDGKSSKKLLNDLGLGVEANQALIRCRHDTGLQHEFQVGIGYYRA